MSGAPAAMNPGPCAGDLSPAEAWERLESDPAAILVDVRTRIELALTGGPDLSPLSREPLFLEWMTQQGRNPEFMAELRRLLAARAAGPDTPILFLCRTAGRSRMAAGELTAEGFRACYNISEGFEGALDEHGHRNSVDGWKARGLPWRQT
jgi:rhodanese-related sulfurtransferase